MKKQRCYIYTRVSTPDFEKGIREKIAARVDTSELEQELDGLKKKMRQLEVSKDKIDMM